MGAIFLLSACSSSKKATDPYAYLRKSTSSSTSGKEPYLTIDIAILDTANYKPPKPPKPPKSSQKDEIISTQAIQKVIRTALSYKGTPYKYGGLNKQGIDCSGLVYLSYAAIKKKVPRSSTGLSKTGSHVRKKKIAPGDLVFFASRGGTRINHVGLVTRVKGGEVTFIHATTSKGVREDRLGSEYWGKRYQKAVRL